MTMTSQQLKTGLETFTGSQRWYRHELYRLFTYTEGVQFLAMEAGAYWLVDLIFSLQYTAPKVKNEGFQCWKLDMKDYAATLICEDANGNKVYSEAIELTDFPMEEMTLWFTDNTLLLPSEW